MPRVEYELMAMRGVQISRDNTASRLVTFARNFWCPRDRNLLWIDMRKSEWLGKEPLGE